MRKFDVGHELLNAPMGEMIRSMASAIADAQWNLDKASMVVAEMMSGSRLLRDLETGDLLDFDGTVIQPLKDEITDEIKRNERGEPIYDSQNGPKMIDSRAYFGYSYLPELDSSGAAVLETVDGEQLPRLRRVPNRVSMMELGFTPNFYQFVDTIIEVKIAIKTTSVSKSSQSWSSSSSSKSTTKSSARRGHTSGWWIFSSWHETGKRDTTTTSTYASSVDASYSSKYGYSVEGSSLMRTKMVPIPPPAILQERIRQVIDTENQYLDDVAGGRALAVRDTQSS